MTVYVIKKDGKFVKDFSDGAEFTKNIRSSEKYTSLKSARIAASQYGRKYGKGYSVTEAFGTTAK